MLAPFNGGYYLGVVNKLTAMGNAFGKTVLNENGGAQSELDTRFDLIPPCQLRKVAEVLAYGADKYGVDNWKLISYEEHLNHVLQHINAEQLGLDTGEPHLQHALVRLFFASYMRDKNPQDFIGKVESKNHCKDIDLGENYSVSATSPTDPETTKNILRIFGMEADTEPPMTMGDFFGEDNDKEYPIIRTETRKEESQEYPECRSCGTDMFVYDYIQEDGSIDPVWQFCQFCADDNNMSQKRLLKTKKYCQDNKEPLEAYNKERKDYLMNVGLGDK